MTAPYVTTSVVLVPGELVDEKVHVWEREGLKAAIRYGPFTLQGEADAVLAWLRDALAKAEAAVEEFTRLATPEQNAAGVHDARRALAHYGAMASEAARTFEAAWDEEPFVPDGPAAQFDATVGGA
jgi:hypothetical protein